MKNSILKMVSIIAIIMFVINIMPSFVKATGSDVGAIILEKANGDRVIYIEGLDSKDFKYAFSSNEDAPETDYTTCNTDSNGENVAYLENDETYDYMFLKYGEETDIDIIELNSLKTITEGEIAEVEKLTTKISVDTNQAITYSSTKEDGTTVTTTVGRIVITDDENCNYKYQLIEILDNNNTVSEVNATAVELYEQLAVLENASKMYEKLKAEITIRDNYKTLLDNAKWADVKEMAIDQPEEAQIGEKYIVLIQKLNNGNVVENDIQFMTCDRKDDADVEYTNTIETKTVEKKKTLPITGENLALYIILGIVILAIIIVAVRMKYLEGKKNGKH